ncbi:NF-kappa-B essential modulator isoform X1 [Drosophila elegans]|uniref:NF-kappa-B essential modulator isoform X1 n=1 Tax=Drosophila elegans TaxID=30023 RepID=UPI0007E5C2CC|nr:NF-kappa-B essential modulator isoform X1 [Drosophila elegans]XP_017125129.1 NF-kappa-B essential modulator isoform X1 [Drosophila elegans]
MIKASSQSQCYRDNEGAMSEEESFVILGSSPYPSLLPDDGSLAFDGLDDVQEAKEPIASTSSQQPAIVESAPISMTASQQPKSLESGSSQHQSLAASFIMGEVQSDVLKNSVYSQFPSLCSLQASAEDVVKLQNMMTEYVTLKNTLDKVNHTMLNYHKLTQQWRQEAADREQDYKRQLQECQEQFEQLREENQKLKEDLETKIVQIEVVQDFSQKEQSELRMSISEKTSLIDNMRVEIDKLQQLKMHSFEFVPEDGGKTDADPDKALNYVQRDEHDRQVRDLQRQLSKLVAENLEITDMKNTYIEEIDCLKVNLTSAQELIAKMQRDIDELKARDIQKQEVIDHLQTQNDIYRRDFEMERADREKNAGEKDQYLMDLKALQRRNQELIEALAESHKASKSASPASSLSSSRSSLREEQRPVRVLDPTGAASRTAEPILRCPICSKSFNAISVLQSHVNDCLDKN